MRTSTVPTVWHAAAAALAFVAAAACAAPPATGNRIDVTVHVHEQMAGMPAIPARTVSRELCTQPGHFDPRALLAAESHAQCRIEHYARKGNTVTFDEVCTAPQAVTSHGVFHLDGQNFTGSMHTAFSAAGHAITVDSDYTGTHTGACTVAAGHAG